MGECFVIPCAIAKHKEKEKQQSPLSCLFFQPNSSKLKQKENNLSTSSSTTVDSLIILWSVSKAEIRFVLKVVSSSFYLQSGLNLIVFFKQTFSDSKLLKMSNLVKQKADII